MSLPVLTTNLIDLLGAIGKRVAPREAVGLIVGDTNPQVLELPNRSLSPNNSFTVTGGDIKLALENNNYILERIDWAAVTLWHTHPSGGVGPSRIDMQGKLPEMNHLVVTIDVPGNQVIPSWY